MFKWLFKWGEQTPLVTVKTYGRTEVFPVRWEHGSPLIRPYGGIVGSNCYLLINGRTEGDGITRQWEALRPSEPTWHPDWWAENTKIHELVANEYSTLKRKVGTRMLPHTRNKTDYWTRRELYAERPHNWKERIQSEH